MAKNFNLTAQINLRGPTNLKPIIADIRRQLGTISSDVNIKLSPQAAKSINAVTSRLKSMNDAIVTAKNNTDSLNASLSNLSASLSTIGNSGNKSVSTITKTASSAKSVAQNIKQATTEMEQFGKQSALAVRRFAAFSIVTGTIYKLVNAINSGFNAFISFDKQLVKLQQVTGKGAIGLKNLENQITSLATSLGVSSESLIEVASTLAQAGLNAEETRIALSALAKTELAPSFDSLTETTEGAIAALRQFELQAGDLESALGSINAVAAAFAVESSDIITAIQRTGGVFAAASKGVSEGKDALNEFIAVFTSVRATTRESAETIATGLRTIFTRIQRGKTIEALKEYGIILTDLEGKFVGPFEAVKRLSEGLKLLDPRDLRFSQIVEELGGFRQIGKVIPLIQQFAEAQKALKVAQTGQSSLTDAQLIAQKSLANQIAKVREQFLALIRDIGKTNTFQAITRIVLNLSSAFISLAGAFKPILPFLAILGTIKGVKAIGEFGSGFFGGLKSTTGTSTAQNIGNTIGSTISGNKEKEKVAATKLATDSMRANTDALKSLTLAVQGLDNTIKSKGSTVLSSGGKVLGFNSGGIVPGSGKGDKVPALLEPGEVIINNTAANKYGRGNLVRMNKYASGGEIFKKQIPGALKGMKDTKPIAYDDISKLKINNSGKGSIRGYFFENFVNKEFGVDAPENKFPDIPNLNVKKGLKEKLGLTKSQTGRDFKAAELKYRSGIKPEFDSQYTPENTAVLYAINKNIGGRIQNFKDAGLVEEEYYGQKEVEAAKAARKALKKTIERMFVDKKGRASFAVKRPVSMSENVSQADREQFTKEGRIVSNPATKLEELLTEKIVRTQATVITKSPQTKKKRGIDARLLRNLAKTGIQSDDKQIIEDAEKAIKSMSPEQIKRLLMGDLKRAPEGEYLKKEAEYELDPEFRKITGLDTGVSGGAVKQFEALAKKNVTKGIFERASYLDRIPDVLGQIKAFKVDLVKQLAQEKDIQIQKSLQQQISKANTAIDVIENKRGTPQLPGQVTALSWAVRQAIPGAKELASGGLVQKFAEGTEGLRGVQQAILPKMPVDKPLTGSQIISGPFPNTREGKTGMLSWKDTVSSTASAILGSSISNNQIRFGDKTISLDKAISLQQLTAANFREKFGSDNVATLFKLRERLLEEYKKAKIIADKQNDLIVSDEDIARARQIAVVGFRSDRKSIDPYYRKRNGVPLHVYPGIAKEEDYADIERLWQEHYELQMRTAASIAGRRRQTAIPVSEEDRKKLGIANAKGYDVEFIMAALGTYGGKKSTQDAVDFMSGLSPLAADVFGVPAGIPTQAKLTISSNSILDSIDGLIKTFAVGGLAEATGEMSSLMSGLYGNRQSETAQETKKQKNFGKIGLRNTGTEITATYFKNAEREGFVSAKKTGSNLYTVGLSKASKGYGPRLYDIVMEAATAAGGMLTSDRNQVSNAAKSVWAYYFNNRSDVKKTPLDPSQWTKNQSNIDPKLYGKKETWPPFDDPAWILQTGYSKTPELINSSDIINMNDPKYAQFLQQQQLSFMTQAVLDGNMRSNGGVISKFASGGTVPAMVSSGEAFVPPKLAKKIGYDKLNKMNQADRNGTQGFSGGGISVFKGPGSGTSDSIGPVGLPEGSFIIREKATKALGLNRGGIVGSIKKFFKGGQSKKDAVRAQGQILSTVEEGATVFADIMSQLPTQLKDIILSKFKGIQNVEPGQAVSSVAGSPAFTERTRGMAVASSKASAIGLQITGKKGGATTETVAHETGHLADIALGGGSNFASETQGTFQFELIAKIKKQMEDEFKKAGKSAEEIDKYLGTGKELFAEFFAKASPEVRAIITSTTDAKVGMEKLVDALGETGFTYAGLQASDIVPPKPKSKKSKPKDQFGFLKQQSKAIDEAKTGAISFESLKPKTKTRREAKQELDDSGLKALTTGITQTSGEIAKLKAQTESLYQQSKSLDNQISQYDQAILKIKSSTEEGAKGNKALNRLIQMKISAETQRLSVDKQAMAGEEQLIALNKQKAQQIAAAKTFKTTGGGGGGPPGGGGPSGPDLPKIDTTGKNPYADETAFIQYKARKEGMGEGEYRRSLATKIADKATGLQRDYSGRKEEFKQSLVARRESFQGIDKTTDVGQAQFNTAVAELAREIQDLNPELKFEDAKIAAEKLANDLAVTGDRARDVGSLMGELGDALPGEIDATKALELAKKQVAKQEGMSEGTLSRAVNAKEIQREQFIRSPEGQRFGRLAEFAPGLTQKFAGTKAGQALGKGADFISGKGGRFSKLFAGAGGFQGIGSGLAVGSELFKNSGLINKKTLKDPNVAGAFGAVQGAGVMGATGAELGGQLAGPIGALVGGIGGAVIGGIKGFFDAKNTQILSNALDKLTKSSEAVDIAFKELAKNDTDKNFKNVQKAFGQQIEASKELENIAFGGDGQGPSVMGVGGGALAGAAGGALIGSIVPVIGTAVGAAVGAAIGGTAAYLFEGQNKANKEEALRNRVGSAGAMNESAARMAERQMGRMTTQQLGQQQQAGANVIAEQYKQSAIAAAEAANGTKNLTAAQKEQISQSAAETAYLDAYMKMRKEAGATDEKISEDILADRKLALQEGKKALQVQSDAAVKQALLARATKEVALATENLLDVYRRVGAKAQRFSDEIDDMLSGTQSNIASLGGNAAVQKVDRSGSERILGNMAAYSSAEVKAATQEMVGKLGGGEEAQALGRQAEAAKFLQDKLPAMLRAPGADPSQIIDSLSQELSTMGLGSDAIDKMLGEIEKQISDNEKGGLGTLADEISAGGIDKFSATAAEAAKVLQNLSKTYNDALQKSIDLQNQYNETIMQSNAYLRKAGTIRINAELDLAKALGNTPTLEQLNQPFDFEIKDLTKGLIPGGTTDPTAIANGIIAATAQNQQLQTANANLGNIGMQGAAGDGGAQMLAEQQKNIAAMGANNVAINEGRQALEKLANDSTKAANALAKIEEQQRQIEGLGNRFEKIFTASPEELFKMNRQSDALALAQTAGAEQFKSRAFRQDAFAGLEQDKEFLSPEEYRKQRAMLMRKSLEAQGYTGQSTIQKGGVNMTVDEFIKRIEGGMPSEEDPNVKAYREAVEIQIKANEELARLEELKSLQIQEAMLGLQQFLADEFPRILTDAITESKADAETKPTTKTEPTKAEKSKLEADKTYDEAKGKRDKIESKITEEKRALARAEKNVGWEQGAGVEVKQRKNKIKELEAQAAQQTSIMNAADAASTEAERSMAAENKAKEDARAAQIAEEKKAKEAKASSAMEESRRARNYDRPRVIQAPPAPGSVSGAFNGANPQQYSVYGQMPSNNTISQGMAQVTNQPIPSNIPKPVEYSRQVQETETGTTRTKTPTETTAQLLTLDSTSLEGLNGFNTTFGSYVDKLVNFQFPTIPEKIEMTGTHTVDVRVTGAAAFESLQKNIQDMINKEIDVKMTQIWQQTGGQIGQRPGTPPSKGR